MMKFLFEIMRFLSKYIVLNQQITYLTTFHAYFTVFQTTAPTRITVKSELPPQNAETDAVSAFLFGVQSGKIP